MSGRAKGAPVVDPNTMFPEYTPAETEFMLALERYKTGKRRRFPTCREILGVLLSLGYRKPEPAPKTTGG